ncbi:MAG: chemotaxis response regulator protein-glutamate methylesterase [Gemmatimonadaceae bacterium]|nr:chemotaxis response regulator protein-glutamate methylesterase [Gemmatimonadaceae bacterium]
MTGTGPTPIRVLIVDDSAVIRGALGRIVDAEPDMTVVTTAPNGRVALDALRHTVIDVVLLDVEMPEMDGLAALPLILAGHPGVRVIMASSLTQKGAEVTMHALALGASDFIAKPAARSGAATLAAISAEIAAKIRAVGRAPRTGAPHETLPPGSAVPRRTELLATRHGEARPRILAIAASTGGPNALATVLGALPLSFALPILITQHMPALFTTLLAQRLERDAHRRCVEPSDGDLLQPGCTYVAPGEYHLTVQTDEGRPVARLTQAPPENFCRPSADPMFRSIAGIYGASTLAVVLTGMGEDGMRGAREVHARGGRVLAQDEATSVVWGMPGAVAAAGIAHAILPLDRIAAAIVSECGLAVAA